MEIGAVHYAGNSTPKGGVSVPCEKVAETRFYNCTESADEVRMMLIRQAGFRAHASNSLDFLAVPVKVEDWVVVHEVGHLMGLADTYEEWGYQRLGEEHDRRMMNGLNSTSLTPDDIAGVRQVWQFVRTGKMECPSGFRQGGADGAAYYRGQKSYLCVRDGTVARTLCSSKAMRDPNRTSWGTEPNGTSCYIGPSPSRTYRTCDLRTNVNHEGWGYQNGQICWRPVIPPCGQESEINAFLPDQGYVVGLEKRTDPNSFCMILACSERVSVKAGEFSEENGQACASKSGIPEEKAIDTASMDGYPFCSNLAVAYAKDPSWGFEPNGVSCRHGQPNLNNNNK